MNTNSQSTASQFISGLAKAATVLFSIVDFFDIDQQDGEHQNNANPWFDDHRFRGVQSVYGGYSANSKKPK